MHPVSDRELSLIGVPTSAGSHHAGQDRTPEALRALGLVERLTAAGLVVADTGDVEGVVWRPDAHDAPARLVEDVTRVAEGVADAVAREVGRGRTALVVGGDCTITLGVVAGVQRAGGSVGLAYLDGDADLTTPDARGSGVLDSMGIAHLIGLADDDLARVGRRLQHDEVVLLGYDPVDLGEDGRALLAGLEGLHAVDHAELAADPEGHARAALARLTQERLMVHFDVDAVDGRDLALGNFPHYATGVSLEQARRTFATLLGDPRVAAVVLTEVNPSYDPSGVLLERYVDAVVGALAGALSS